MSVFLECGPISARTEDGRVLVQDISLSFQESQSVAINGSSGSGKSTLLRHLTALVWSPEVSRCLNGKCYGGAALQAWRANVTLLAQDAPMIPGTVLDNLRFPFQQRAGRDTVFSTDRASQLLSDVQLGTIPLDRDIRMLSGGERHRLGLARGLLWDPPVLVADEPLSGLDPETAAACFELLLRFAERPKHLLVCVLHDPTLTRRAKQRLRLNDGRLQEH